LHRFSQIEKQVTLQQHTTDDDEAIQDADVKILQIEIGLAIELEPPHHSTPGSSMRAYLPFAELFKSQSLQSLK
jgi:hypothetical protein